MASTTSLFTGLSGLAANSRRLDVIGNNISNVNTTAFKSNRLLLAPTFSRNFSLGTSPNAESGGTNPGQVGLGVTNAGTQRNFNNGSISATGIPTDVAIEGDGFFIVERAGQSFYTRAGAFQRNEANDLVTISGERVMGFGIDDEFSIIEGNLQPINIPLGTLTLAEASDNVVFNGNLNASGPIPTTGALITSRALSTDPNDLAGSLASPTLDLTVPGNDLYIDDGASGTFVAITAGDPGAKITISGIEKGGKDLGEFTFQFSTSPPSGDVDETGTTLQDYMNWLEARLGLSDTTIDGQSLGGGVSMSNGQIVVTGNEGTAQDLVIETSDIIATENGANGIQTPFFMTKEQAADGESVRTSFVVYDSLGTPLTVDLTFVLQETTAGAGTTWQFIAESNDNEAGTRVIGQGVAEFDATGKFSEASNQQFSIVRTNGSVSPLVVQMDFDSGSDAISGLADSASNLAAVFQDGSPIGTLSTFSIGETGVITGAFTNGLTRDIGQIAVGKFPNPEGLVDVGSNLFSIGPNSGDPIVTAPLEFGTGRLLGGSLELSNVDLSREFIDLILTSTGYSASTRIIQTTDELIQQLLVLGR